LHGGWKGQLAWQTGRVAVSLIWNGGSHCPSVSLELDGGYMVSERESHSSKLELLFPKWPIPLSFGELLLMRTSPYDVLDDFPDHEGGLFKILPDFGRPNTIQSLQSHLYTLATTNPHLHWSVVKSGVEMKKEVSFLKVPVNSWWSGTGAKHSKV
jgi:hypothetical protein